MTRLRDNLLLVIAAAFLVVGAFGWWMSTRADDEPANAALTDKAATSEVQAAVTKALTGVLSYRYDDPRTTEQLADTVLSGDARSEYDQLVASLHEKAPAQRLVLTAQVQAAAVKELTDDSAMLLVFVDQVSQRADDEEASVSAAQLSVEAEKVGGSWTITQLRPL